MSGRGRYFYDPIIQSPSRVPTPGDMSRIELYPEKDIRDDGIGGGTLRWVGRRIGPDGLIHEVAPGDFSHDGALAQAQNLWPGLEVYELREESDDSTHEGMSPSPRLWQVPPVAAGRPTEPPSAVEVQAPGLIEEPPVAPVEIRVFAVGETGTYVLLDDVVALLGQYADVFEAENNLSAALGLREAVRTLKEPF